MVMDFDSLITIPRVLYNSYSFCKPEVFHKISYLTLIIIVYDAYLILITLVYDTYLILIITLYDTYLININI